MFININLQFKNPPADFKIINKSKKIQHNPQTALPLKPNEKKKSCRNSKHWLFHD